MMILGYLVLIYLFVGVVFALAFSIKGCEVIDVAAKDSGIVFRVMVFPAATLLWPYVLTLWQGAQND